jgi:UPF0271 protein
MVANGEVEAIDGTIMRVEPDSLCAHGDGPEALAIVRAVRERLERAGIRVAPFAP